jgi:2-polyprenyl-3-methyl-5-hydroxy-6-metoxy-1,4-benzoquinol methylase
MAAYFQTGDSVRALRRVSQMGNVVARLNMVLKWIVFPGFDLHTRGRYRFLPRFFVKGRVKTLDAGCGNGALAYAAYRLGNRVLGVTLDVSQVEKANALFKRVGVDRERLKFEVLNLYDLHKLECDFDQIICSETLEHIRDDQRVIASFYNLLKEGGVLHLCCPNAMHPAHRLGRVDNPEDGGHVRDGYTLESYRTLLETAGFRIEKHFGIGSAMLSVLDRPVRALRNRVGDIFAFPLFILVYPLTFLFDRLDPPCPLSLYVMAVKEKRTA